MIRSAESAYFHPQFIQMDAPIHSRNPYSQLLDREDRVIGTNFKINSSNIPNGGVGLEIPINTAAMVVPELMETGICEYVIWALAERRCSPGVSELNGVSPNR